MTGVLSLGLVFAEPEAITRAIHLQRCHWCAIGSPACRGLSSSDHLRSAEFRALRDLLARDGKEDSMPGNRSRGTRIG